MLNPSTYSKTSGKRNNQPTLLNKSSVKQTSIHDQIESDGRSLEDSPSAGFPQLSGSKQNYPGMALNQPMIINNISMVQHQPSYKFVRKTRKNAQSHKRFASNPAKRTATKPMARKTTHGDMVSRISEKEVVFSA